MAIIKSFSFPDRNAEIRGDMFYIKHNNGTFTVIDCFLLTDGSTNDRSRQIIPEIISQSSDCEICRFISTHPDQDHIAGLDMLDSRWPIVNFYSVANEIPAEANNDSLAKYIELKNSDNNYEIRRGINRPWLNDERDGRMAGGIRFHWPVLSNEKFKAAQKVVKEGGKVNNICPIFTYSKLNGATVMWMGDLETGMQREYYRLYSDQIPHVDILFAPHHGRDSGTVPPELLSTLNPSIIIIGNAPAEYVNYGDSNKTITQNTSGDIVFDVVDNKVHIYTQNAINNKPTSLHTDWHMWYVQRELLGCGYLGTLTVN